MFNNFEYVDMLKQCNSSMLSAIADSLLRYKFCLYRKEKLICVQQEIQRRINEGSYE
nr:MAG TPA: hypothetical protein [Caudoviricetes sp.]